MISSFVHTLSLPSSRVKKIALYLATSFVVLLILTLSYLHHSTIYHLQFPEDELTPPNSFYAYKPYNDSYTNNTLNFGQLVYINTPKRYDRDDAIAIQSELSGLKALRYVGVEASTLNLKGLGPVPPFRDDLTHGVLACLRSHANVWQQLLLGKFSLSDSSGDKDFIGLHRDLESNFKPSSQLKSIFVLEADAAWDINIRRSMFNFGRGLEQFLNSKGLLKPGEHATEDDPWLSEHWDVMQFNGCFLNDHPRETFQVYDVDSPVTKSEADPYWAPNNRDENSPNRGYFEIAGAKVKPGHRLIRYRSEEVCTAGYAISQRGALKLLARAASNIDSPVDIIIRDMVAREEIDTYSSYPMMIAQWSYAGSLGMDWKNSDIHSKEHNFGDDNDEPELTEKEMSKMKNKWQGNKNEWAQAHEQKRVWMVDSSVISDAAFNYVKKEAFGEQ